jgi:hypothetical protein
MREGLRALRKAGLTRQHFSARFEKKNSHGFIVLNNILGPAGQMEDHIWIRQEHWHDPIPRPGPQVNFIASIEPYRKRSGENDFGLSWLEVI